MDNNFFGGARRFGLAELLSAGFHGTAARLRANRQIHGQGPQVAILARRRPLRKHQHKRIGLERAINAVTTTAKPRDTLSKFVPAVLD